VLLLMLTMSACRPADGSADSEALDVVPKDRETHGMPTVGEGMEVEVSLNVVPHVVKEAAQNALPGIVLSEAEVKRKQGVLVYSLDGTHRGIEYELEVLDSGVLLGLEVDDDDDD